MFSYKKKSPGYFRIEHAIPIISYRNFYPDNVFVKKSYMENFSYNKWYPDIFVLKLLSVKCLRTENVIWKIFCIENVIWIILSYEKCQPGKICIYKILY